MKRKRHQRKRHRISKTISRERYVADIRRRHSVGIDSPSVIEFGDEALREAFRKWWHPYDMGADFDALTGQRSVQLVVTQRTKHGGAGKIHRSRAPKHAVMRGDTIERRKLDPDYYRHLDRAFASKRKRKKREQPSARPAPVKVLITLTYPLNETRTKLVTIDRRYPGAVFALAHDFYRELYAEDEARGGEAGPMNDGKGPLLNRGKGPLVWGHDLGDLVFESCEYRARPGAYVQTDERGQVVALRKTRAAKRRGEVEIEGVFTFGIGS